jgi:hypothetical protein
MAYSVVFTPEARAQLMRDYAFGWLLVAIFNDTDLKNILIFTGGNCFRKAYFPNTRFSADLDFSTETAIEILARATRSNSYDIADQLARSGQLDAAFAGQLAVPKIVDRMRSRATAPHKTNTPLLGRCLCLGKSSRIRLRETGVNHVFLAVGLNSQCYDAQAVSGGYD